ncbi:hypothetical protein ACJW30_05G161000 [Castanea mollissima]
MPVSFSTAILFGSLLLLDGENVNDLAKEKKNKRKRLHNHLEDLRNESPSEILNLLGKAVDELKMKSKEGKR